MKDDEFGVKYSIIDFKFPKGEIIKVSLKKETFKARVWINFEANETKIERVDDSCEVTMEGEIEIL